MKKIILIILISTRILIAQQNSNFKTDSLKFAQKIALQKMANELASAERVLSDKAISDAKIALSEAQSAKDKKFADSKALKDLIAPSEITALSGDVTFSSNEHAIAETRVLVYKNIDFLLNNFLVEINSMEDKKDIIIYNSMFIEAIPDYYSITKELINLKELFREEIRKVKNSGQASIIPSISIATNAIKSIIGLSTLLKTETEFKSNQELISESILISKLRNLDKSQERNYYYPVVFPIINSKPSEILSILQSLKQLNLDFDTEIQNKENPLKVIKLQLNKLESDKAEKVEELKKGKIDDTTKRKLTEAIRILDTKIVAIEESIKDPERQAKEFREVEVKLRLLLNGLLEELEKVGVTTKEPMLRTLIKLEEILNKVNSGASVLKISASAKGTNKIKKFLWGTSLKHSAIVELEYQLYGKDCYLLLSNSVYKYTPYVKGKNINEFN